MAGYAADVAGIGEEAALGESDLSPRRIWMAVRRRWWLVAAVFVIVLALGIWRTMSKTPLYQAQATVRVSQQQAPIAGMQNPQGFQDYRVDRLLTETNVIKSAEVAKRVAASLGLQVQIERPKNLPRIDVFGA